MRNQIRTLFLLFVAFLTSSSIVNAQGRQVAGHHAQGASVSISNSQLSPTTPGQGARVQFTGAQGNHNTLAYSPMVHNSRPPSPNMTSTCGPDTLMYPFAKATGLRILGFSDSLAFGQWYPAPQTITVRGMSFYAWVDSATNQTVTLVCRLYNAGPDSLPLGAPLATATIVIDSNFYGGSLALLEKSVTFPSPVNVNSAYVVTVQNNSAISCGFVSNDYVAGDGNQEWLGHIYLPTPTSSWLHGYQVNVGPSTLFNADNLIYPHVSYQLTSAFQPNPSLGCVGVPSVFQNQSSPVIFSPFYNTYAFAGILDSSFTWTYGTGIPVENVINGNNTYLMVGPNTVTLRDSLFAWRSGPCADVSTGSITISTGAAVAANYTYTAPTVAATFTDGSTGGPLAWSWDFGDGGSSTLQNPTHTYASNGVYTVCLIAANACGTDTVCQTVLVGALPSSGCDTVGNITGTPNLYNSNLWGFVSGHNNFLDSAKAEKFTLGGTFAFQEALFWFALKRTPTPLTSKVIATVWDATGPGGSPGAVLAAQDLFYNNVDTTGALTSVLFPAPINTNGNFFVGIQLIYQPGDTIALITNTDPQTSPATGWELFSGASSWVPYDDASSWGLEISNAIWVVQTVQAAFTSTTAALSATFTNQSIGSTGWLWDFGDGSTSTLQNPSHTYASSGTYNVCLVSLNNTCADTVCHTVTVSSGCPPPVANFSSTAAQLLASFTDLSTSTTTITSWQWNFGDGNTSPVQSPTHTYATPGTYNVCLTVTNACTTSTICQPLTVTCPTLVASFSDSIQGFQYGVFSTSLGSPTTYLYDFGDGSTSTQPNAIHIYAAAGVYNVCLTVTDACSSDSTCVTIIIGCPIPVANWSFITTGQTVAFSDLSTNLPSTWAWDFGDGNTSAVPSPSHTYATPGVFNACLIVTSGCGADTLCDTVVSGCNTPVAAFSNITSNLVAAFTDLSTNTPTSWAWTFGDGGTSAQQSPGHTYTTPGTYTVCLTASSACGSTTTCNSITVSCAPPTAAFTNTLSGLTATFTNTSVGGTSYSWTFGDGGTSTVMNPTHTYSQSGTYQVCLVTTSACGTNTFCSVISFNCPTPVANFSFSNINLSYNFTSLATGNPTSLLWQFGDGSTSTLAAPSHAYANTGTFLVCLLATNSCGVDTFCQAINVTCPAPVANFTSTPNNLSVTFADQTTGNPVSWQWDFGDGSPASLQANPSHTYSAPGTYTVCLIAVNSCGSSNQCNTITIGCPAPTPNFSFLTTGPTVDFTNSSVGGATSYTWDFGDGASSSFTNPSHSYAATGTFTACLIAASTCGQDTFCQTVIITCVPPASSFSYAISSDSIVNFLNLASTNTVSWLWTFGDGSSTTAANPTHTYAAPGTYTACLEVINTCGRDTICQDITITCVNPTAAYTVQLTNAVASFTNLSLLGQTYNWTFGDGTSSTLPNPVHSYSSSGIYTACVTVTNFCGTNTACQNLVISCNPPVATFNAINGASSVGFTDLSSNFPTQWLWNFGDGSTDTVQNPNHVFLLPGQYFVCLRATNSCGTHISCQWITVTAVGTEEPTSLEQSLTISPNPSSGLFQVNLELQKRSSLQFKVVNQLGQEVLRLNPGKVQGAFQQTIDLGQFADGAYHLQIQAGDQILHRQLVKQ